MPKLFKTAGSLALLAVLFCPIHAQAAEDCMQTVYSMQQRFSSSNLSLTAVVSDARIALPYSYTRRVHGGHEYAEWRSLNGEVVGYAMRDLEGYDFNEDKQLKLPLAWHSTGVFDRLMSPKNRLEGYQCTLSGRTRLNGHKVQLLRIFPGTDPRYSFGLAVDDDSHLPVEVNLMSPAGNIVTKISATSLSRGSNLTLNDADFAGFISKEQSPETVDPWGFLNLPPHFTMTEKGSVRMSDGDVSPYQQFSDGIFSFRVYINSISSIYLPEVSAGSISIFRMRDANREYCVTGEIPMDLAKSVLKNVGK